MLSALNFDFGIGLFQILPLPLEQLIQRLDEGERNHIRLILPDARFYCLALMVVFISCTV
jgi:hypothetical protein